VGGVRDWAFREVLSCTYCEKGWGGFDVWVDVEVLPGGSGRLGGT